MFRRRKAARAGAPAEPADEHRRALARRRRPRGTTERSCTTRSGPTPTTGSRAPQPPAVRRERGRRATRASGVAPPGGLQVPVHDGSSSLDVDQESGQVSAVTVVAGAWRVQVMVFAARARRASGTRSAPRSRPVISSSGRRRGRRHRHLGEGLRPGCPAIRPPAAAAAAVRFTGVDGPRWFLRAMFTGPAAATRRPPPARGIMRSVSWCAAATRWPPATACAALAGAGTRGGRRGRGAGPQPVLRPPRRGPRSPRSAEVRPARTRRAAYPGAMVASLRARDRGLRGVVRGLASSPSELDAVERRTRRSAGHGGITSAPAGCRRPWWAAARGDGPAGEQAPAVDAHLRRRGRAHAGVPRAAPDPGDHAGAPAGGARAAGGAGRCPHHDQPAVELLRRVRSEPSSHRWSAARRPAASRPARNRWVRRSPSPLSSRWTARAGSAQRGLAAALVEQGALTDAIGGWRGMVDSAARRGVPGRVHPHRPGADPVHLGRGRRRGPDRRVAPPSPPVLEAVVSGLIGVAFCAWLALPHGQAEDFYLPGLFWNVLYAAVLAGSALLRRPALGCLVGALPGT